MVAKGDFTVTVSKKEVVAAVLPLQEHWLPQSNLDLLLPAIDVGVFFCYKKPAAAADNINKSFGFGSMVDVLKKAMAEALVSYYALAGEVVYNDVGEPELLCNNRGVDFVEAYANVELKDLNLYNPDDTIEGKLVAKKKNGVLSVQATELKCGGIVVACTFDHRIADAYSTDMFLVSWAEIAQSKPISVMPSFRRSMLNPRRPLCIDHEFDNMYVPISTLPPPPPPPHNNPQEANCNKLVSRIYYIKSEQLNELQLLATTGSNGRRTKLESFSAFLWKMVARSANDGMMITKMGIVVDGRTRLSISSNKGDHNNNNVNKSISCMAMGSYFGNALSIPFGGQNVKELVEKPLSWVATQVHDFLENAVTKDHFLGLIDWVEAHRPDPALAKIYCTPSSDGPAFVVSSGQRFPVSKVDFGWGKPAFGSYHFPWGGDAGYVMPMPSPAGNSDWVIYMHLSEKQLDLIETQASNVFKPMTFDYLLSGI
ncbi:hypothetical protein WN944_028334 [Citrus x changshan-huyou]|uniref:HXXXD-type acyl-transferase family protein n=2 Tax=Citrus TaxID=2706 RepID=A0ACB8IYG5_CITSI|nr:HXXXD-type acyl-transferase family protein [Citrus sinensis]